VDASSLQFPDDFENRRSLKLKGFCFFSACLRVL
jgi:hypothetical protein